MTIVLNRIDYLRKKDNSQECDKQETEALSNFISNKIILSVTTDEEATDVCNSFIEYFMNKCNSIIRFKELLNENMLEDKANIKILNLYSIKQQKIVLKQMFLA
ncbi:ankyrin repeat with 1d ankyrin repeats domain protein [Orientia tsutsugamushi str. Gilliam]|uniref:Ankyrin repeat with 1d ankyrin repeats domain protein n=1 Tax=Orientia tsutsugamushi str. Gilliam TaxID=1359184 RepID=A0A0F3ME06_ORITS|nr:hypothetical protein [Orientia tsutsugamushi]KJV52784.1 ankyrin repeat with 1d ankyrin repeats domain protein [Orientia tsutsugamushi str. Gilliam]SPR09859.1 Uncharacterised protein [Orientia tsutsugamushi str. Gilliam]